MTDFKRLISKVKVLGVWAYDHIIRSVPKWKNTSGTPGEKINGLMGKELNA